MIMDYNKYDFQRCVFYLHGNYCISEEHYKNCKYKNAISALETIMCTQKYCALCNNLSCKNSNTQESNCHPIWNGIKI